MATISEKLAQLKNLNVREVVIASLQETTGFVADLNRERMLYSGTLSDGKLMPRYSYTSVTVYGYPPGPWRLKNTGAFQQAIKVTVDKNDLVQTSDDSKTKLILDKLKAKGYPNPEFVFGLDSEGKAEEIDYVQPIVLDKVREKLSLRITQI